ncbi:MAG TPA: lamin tail domain-containing protein, partial [Candidatus Binatia bacterium]|nr:lamin tail domain-containing protein [Candidatus Binatia bacterium]
ELLSRPTLPGFDTVELFNPTANPVDIGGWFLSDDAATPVKFRFPTNTIIAAGGFLVLDESQFNPTPGTNNSFAFGLRGDDVYLFSGDANTNLTGYSHGFTFGGAAEGVSFGRHVISPGEEHFTAQLAVTFGGTNAGPRIGPVVINEIHYHPAPEHDEFIELRNITTSPVDLFDPAHPTNTWRLNGAGFTFPANVTLEPNGFALVTALTPAAFRAKYSIPGAIPLFGPLAGLLQDSGERLELQRPETPDTNGVLWITVDVVRYNDKLPWPASADGDGPSLQRLDSAAYGDDPANWFASGITPGAANAFNQAPTVALTSPANGAQFVAPVNITLTASASDADGIITRVEFFDSGVKLGESTNAPFALVWTNVPVGTHTLTAKARDNGLALNESSSVVVTIRQPVLTNLTFIPLGSVWRYHDKGQNLGTNWTALAYNDSGWSNGLAQLGYGDGDEATVLSYGPNAANKYITTYFRRTFVNTAPIPVALTLNIQRDDGILVWLNGSEVFRDNMPGGPIAYNTLASSSLGPPLENTFIQTNPSPALVIPGTNVLAVEIHQGAVDSSDISFDLELVATLIQPDPQLAVIVAGGQLRLLWPALAGPFHLEQTTNLTPPVSWSPASDLVTNDGYWNQVRPTNNPASTQRFFRLHRD